VLVASVATVRCRTALVLVGAAGRRVVGVPPGIIAMPAMPAMSAVPTVSAVPEDVHQRAREDEEEGQQLKQVGVVADEHPSHGRGEADPQQPLIDAGPIRAALAALTRVVWQFHDGAP